MIDRLVVLGPGTILPLPDYGCSGYLLYWKTGADSPDADSPVAATSGERSTEHPILVDCGPGTLDRLYEYGVPVEEIDFMLISHFHIDHVSDLAAILLSRWLRNLGKPGDVHHMTIVGPKGLTDYLAKVSELNQPWISEYTFDVVEPEAGSFVAPFDSRYAGFSVRTAPTGHTENSICFRIVDEANRCVFYSGDTDYNEELIPLAKEADLAILECSMPDDKKLPGHLTPHLSGKLAEKAGVHRLLLTHFYEEVLMVDIVKEVNEEFRGPVELARKLHTYSLV
jgi:ribonuclease BN (tRNA processing enzyme)